MEDPSDDYVAQLLAKDAKTSATKYSLYGLQAFLPRRLDKNAPKPNTRFLKNIIRETDNHNAALKAKEEREAHIRLRDLRHNGSSASTSNPKERRLGDGNDHQSKRLRLDEINGILNSRSDNDRRSRPAKDRVPKSHHHRQSRRHGDESSSDRNKEDIGRSKRRHSHQRRHRRHERSEFIDESEQDEDGHRAKLRRRRRSRSCSPRSEPRTRDRHRSSRHGHKRSRSPTPDPTHHGNSHPYCKKTPTPPNTHDSDSDSDPLEALGLIGPKPPPPPPTVKSRGRGAFASNHAATSSSSAIDQHFTSAYDPAVDVVPDVAEDGDDWDQALEALKDRQKWQQNQAERMRQAGFTEEEVAKWEKGKGGEGREEDVRWKGRGEGREWDRGKVVDANGGVVTEVEWGRLKGT